MYMYNIYMYICVCIYICIYTYICTYIYTYIYIDTCTYYNIIHSSIILLYILFMALSNY